MLNHLLNNTIEQWTEAGMSWNEEPDAFLAHYPDFIAFVLVIIMSVLIASGVKIPVRVSGILTTFNIAIATFNVILAFSLGKVSNIVNPGYKGFMPYGVHGVLTGAAKCFFAYIGFDCIAIAAEEAKNPTR